MNILNRQLYCTIKSLFHILLIVVFLLMPCTVLATPHQNKFIEVELTKVVDGDTFYALYCGLSIKVRLYGVDAPEREEIGYNEATQFLTSILTQQANIGLEIINYDGFGRTVAIIYIGEGKTVQELLLQEGVAIISEEYCKLDICNYWKSFSHE